MVYGGPHVQTVTESWAMTADLTAQYLAERGFAVWKMDNRGSARRGPRLRGGARTGTWGRSRSATRSTASRSSPASWPEVDTSRVGITGGSYGGYMTLRCLTEAPDVFQAGVAVAPVTDWDGYDTCYTERYMGTPANNPEGYATSSVLTRVDRLRGDLLVIHGMLDENVHFRHTARLTTALIAAGKPFELLPLPDERHSLAPRGRPEVRRRADGRLLRDVRCRPRIETVDRSRRESLRDASRPMLDAATGARIRPLSPRRDPSDPSPTRRPGDPRRAPQTPTPS